MSERTRHRFELTDVRMNLTGLQCQADRWEPVGCLGLEHHGENRDTE